MAKRTDVTKYDRANLSRAHEASLKSETEFYRNGDYLSYIKQRCLSLFLTNSSWAFTNKNENPSAETESFSCYEFPTSGREHDFQAFKKLNLANRIPDFNKCHSDFYKTIVPIWERVQNIFTEHHKRWKSLEAYEKVDLVDKLHSLYKGRDNSEIYNQYFIFENEYLRQQFDRFLSAKDFSEWWEHVALNVLK